MNQREREILNGIRGQLAHALKLGLDAEALALAQSGDFAELADRYSTEPAGWVAVAVMQLDAVLDQSGGSTPTAEQMRRIFFPDDGDGTGGGPVPESDPRF